MSTCDRRARTQPFLLAALRSPGRLVANATDVNACFSPGEHAGPPSTGITTPDQGMQDPGAVKKTFR